MTISDSNIHILELYNQYFMYDVATNAIFSITKEMCKFLLNGQKGKETEVNDELKEELEYLTDSGCLRPAKEGVVVEHFETSLLESLYENNMNTIILQVTQNCNLRCQYCVYSGSYINRVHNNKRMSVEIAKQAIDFLAKHSINSKEISIGFYGGEPLLEFSLIQEVVDYAEKLFIGKRVLFNMTTNATLLNMETAKYLYDKKFNVTISLDGPALTLKILFVLSPLQKICSLYYCYLRQIEKNNKSPSSIVYGSFFPATILLSHPLSPVPSI